MGHFNWIGVGALLLGLGLGYFNWIGVGALLLGLGVGLLWKCSHIALGLKVSNQAWRGEGGRIEGNWSYQDWRIGGNV